MLTVGSCFSGIGGLELGLEWTGGFKTEWQIEKDLRAAAVLVRRWPSAKWYGDIKLVATEELGPVDVVCGGFPCQPHSISGKRKGGTDDRNLWPEMLRIVNGKRPKFVIAENVPGIFDTGYAIEVLASLEEIGYCATPIEIFACEMGAPHPRRRVFFMAHAFGLRCWPWCKLERSAFDPIWQRQKAEWEASYSEKLKSRDSYSRDTRESGKKKWWPTEPGIKRVVNGVPRTMDRLRCIGNAVVPQVAQKIGEMILRYEESKQCA